jgi:hypothetical protein
MTGYYACVEVAGGREAWMAHIVKLLGNVGCKCEVPK